MNCPRCGHQTPAERAKCVECAWLLSQAYQQQEEAPAEATVLMIDPEPEPAAPYDPEYLPAGPQQVALWRGENSNTTPRRLRRAQRRHSPQTLGNTAVAVMPEEAQWAAPAQLEYIHVPLVQSRFEFRPEEEAEQLAARACAPGRTRLLAAGLDFLLVAAATAIFIGLFASLSGGLGIGRSDLLIYLAAGFAITSAYFGLFTMTSAATPGMLWRGLRTVTFEGKPPGFHHRLWRSFGYVVSTGSLLLGFFWAAVDEKRLSWHDYISGTFLTDRDDL